MPQLSTRIGLKGFESAAESDGESDEVKNCLCGVVVEGLGVTATAAGVAAVDTLAAVVDTPAAAVSAQESLSCASSPTTAAAPCACSGAGCCCTTTIGGGGTSTSLTETGMACTMIVAPFEF